MPTGAMELILGPMFSGKSTELLRRIRRHTIASRRSVVIKYKADTRYDKGSMATHDRQLWTAKPCSKLQEARSACASADVIGIDEGQFFPDLFEFCCDMTSAGKVVIVAALDGTFQRRPFGRVLELVPMAESVTKLSAVCMLCSRDAAFSKRIGSETEVEVIGGADKYIAVCRTCYDAEVSSAQLEQMPSAEAKIRQAQAAMAAPVSGNKVGRDL